MRIVIFLSLIFIILNVKANEIGKVTGFKIPRFVSLKSNDVNLRIGPSTNYPIIINYIQKNFPVEIIKEHDVWRQVKDIEGNIGWIHAPLLKGDRYGIIFSKNDSASIFNYPNGIKIGKIGNKNIVKIEKCLEKWCLISLKKNKGWLIKNDLWGIYSSEIYKINFMQPLINLYWKIIGVISKFIF